MAKTRKSTSTKKEPAHSTKAGVHKKVEPKRSSHHAAKGGTTSKGRPRPKSSHTANGSAHLTNATNTEPPPFIVKGTFDAALFTLTAYRGEGMCLLAMNWKNGQPSDDFVGFAIEYMPPGSKAFIQLQNRIAFSSNNGQVNANTLSSRLSPFQKFRWIHFPETVDTPGTFIYRVTSVFMDDQKMLSYGHYQEADISLKAETYPGEINIAFTRGFISSQAFVDKFGTNGGVGTILPTSSKAGITFKPTDPKAPQALAWMGFEVREAIFNALNAAATDTSAQVRVAAYDFDDPEVVDRLEKLGSRLKIIIDDSGSHKPADSSESKAAAMLAKSAGADNVQRQHMGDLQHNKSIVINGDNLKIAVGGSANLSWRGLYVQNNNAVILQGDNAVKLFEDAFDALWASPNNVSGFDNTPNADWEDLGYDNIQAQVTFSPHSKSNAKLAEIGKAIAGVKSSLFYSLAFLYETKGVIRNAIQKVTDGKTPDVFVYGISDKSVGGLDVQEPDGNPPVAYPDALNSDNLPEPFKEESTGGYGVRLHHKFVVLDFNTPDATVYTGSYNFSIAADTKNAENLFVIKDQRIATSYAVEALAMFDHYSFRDREDDKKDRKDKNDDDGEGGNDEPIELQEPPTDGGAAWWAPYWNNPTKVRDRELFGL